jgi:CBS domain-containing protein
MRVRDVMTTPAVSVPLRTPLGAAAALLVAHGFTGAPVVDDEGRLVGIVTEADLVRGQIPPDGWAGAQPPNPPVVEVMTPTPLAMRPEDDLSDVVATMLDARLRTLPIVDDGVLVGVLSRRDVLRCVARRELTSAQVRARRSDGFGRPRGAATPS